MNASTQRRPITKESIERARAARQPIPRFLKLLFITAIGFLLTLGGFFLLGKIGEKWDDWRDNANWKEEVAKQTRDQMREYHNRGTGAYVAAHEFVRKALKAPSSAKFSDTESGSYEDKARPGHFHAFGYVDAQNSFGAPLRQRWDADLEYRGESGWRAEAITIGGKQVFSR